MPQMLTNSQQKFWFGYLVLLKCSSIRLVSCTHFKQANYILFCNTQSVLLILLLHVLGTNDKDQISYQSKELQFIPTFPIQINGNVSQISGREVRGISKKTMSQEGNSLRQYLINLVLCLFSPVFRSLTSLLQPTELL